MSNLCFETYCFNGKGSANKVILEDCLTEKQSSQPIWYHFDGHHPETKNILTQAVGHIDPLIIKALTAEETRPRMVQIGEGILLILRGVNLNENSAPEDMVSIRLWIEAGRIFSVQRRQLKSIKDLQEKLLEGQGPKNSGEFITALVSRLFERIDLYLLTLDEQTEVIEAQLLDDSDKPASHDVAEIRKKTIIAYSVPNEH